jgi:hypothetical protein
LAIIQLTNPHPALSFRLERPVFFLAREPSTGREVEESLFDLSGKPRTL